MKSTNLLATLVLAGGAALLGGCAAAGRATAPVIVAPPPHPAATMSDLARPVDWSAFAAVLRKDVTDSGRVDYFDIAHAQPLQGLMDLYAVIARTGPLSQPRAYPTRADKLAYYLNAHNLLAIVLIAPRFGPATIDPAQVAALPAPLETGFVFTLDGQPVSLGTLRRERIVPLLDGDPRPLLAVCAGRRNDPPLRREAYSADAATLDGQLADQLVRVLREPPWCQIDFQDQRIELPAGIADYREYYWAGYLAQPGRVRDQVGFPTVLLHFADARGRGWLNRGLSYDVVRAEPSDQFNNTPLFPSRRD